MMPNRFPIIPDSLLVQIKVDLAQGKKIDAIKHLRDRISIGLGEAKEFVEAIQSGVYGNIIDGNTEETIDSLQNKLLVLENQKESLEFKLAKSGSLWFRLEGNNVALIESSLQWVKIEISKIKSYLKKMGVVVDEPRPQKETDEKHSFVIHNYGTITNSNLQNEGIQSLQLNAPLQNLTKEEQITELLHQLSEEIKSLHSHLSEEVATQVKQDFDVLNAELTSKSPRKQWYELSINGLIQAAKNLGEIGKPILGLATQILLLLK